jgi:hypothetical protein
VTKLPNLDQLSHGEKDALIRALWAQVQALTARVAALEARLGEPPKSSGNASQPPSRDHKANREDNRNGRVRARAAWAGRAEGGCWRRPPTRP